jgi:hypothetical protein
VSHVVLFRSVLPRDTGRERRRPLPRPLVVDREREPAGRHRSDGGPLALADVERAHGGERRELGRVRGLRRDVGEDLARRDGGVEPSELRRVVPRHLVLHKVRNHEAVVWVLGEQVGAVNLQEVDERRRFDDCL